MESIQDYGSSDLTALDRLPERTVCRRDCESLQKNYLDRLQIRKPDVSHPLCRNEMMHFQYFLLLQQRKPYRRKSRATLESEGGICWI